MEIEVIEKTAEKLKLKVNGESHTFLNLLRDKAWLAKADQAGYIIEHPYLSTPEVVIRSKNPKKTLSDASDLVAEDCRAFLRELKKEAKK